MAGAFSPEKFEDDYETALVHLINRKRAGKTVRPKGRPQGDDAVDLMEALHRSVGQEAQPSAAAKPAKKPRKAAAGRKEMLMPIAGRKTSAKAASGPRRLSPI